MLSCEQRSTGSRSQPRVLTFLAATPRLIWLSRKSEDLECVAELAGIVHVREVGEKPLKRLEEPSR